MMRTKSLFLLNDKLTVTHNLQPKNGASHHKCLCTFNGIFYQSWNKS